MSTNISSLTKKEDFKSLLKGKKKSNKYLTIFFKKIAGKNNRKLNISFVTKKKIGNAVKRNKIKRRLRNIMHNATKKIHINLNYCYLVIAKETSINCNYNDFKEIIFKDLEKIK
mgnify:CR=1 FL=1|tara:strand:+ start:422 stop:763 length:342 start_codon:yes stop_codon:yes gene_type:complete